MMDPKTKAHQPTAAEREDFNYFWQHLRRNPRYKALFTELQELNSLWKRTRSAEGVEKLWKTRLALQNRSKRRLGLLEPLDPKINDSAEAVRLVLLAEPGYFASAHWQAVRAKQISLPAAWNERGADGCAWDNALADRFARLSYVLNVLENHQDPETDNYQSKEAGITIEKYQARAQAKLEEERGRMRALLEKHSQMDFVLDASLPWNTVRKALERVWEGIKRLRKEVGLAEDIDPARRRLEWPNQLRLYDAYLPQYEANRQKREILQLIWRGNLRFAEAFQQLGLEMTQEDLDLARALDNAGKKPKGFYDFLEKKEKEALLAGGWEDGIENVHRRREHRVRRGALWFDEEPEIKLTAMVSKHALRTLDADYWGGIGTTLASWRPHFSIPAVVLPSPFSAFTRKMRNRWFHAARDRIEKAWPRE